MDAGCLSRCSPLTVMLIRILKISLEEIRDPSQYNTYQFPLAQLRRTKSFSKKEEIFLVAGRTQDVTLHNSISIISIKLSIKPVTDPAPVISDQSLLTWVVKIEQVVVVV